MNVRRNDAPVPEDFVIRDVEAGKNFTMLGRAYRRGDPVDVSPLPDHKVRQMLNQRTLRPSARTLASRSVGA